MYRLGQRQQKHRKQYISAASSLLLFVVLSIGGYNYIKNDIKSNTSVTQAAAVTTKVNLNNSPTTTFAEPDFTIALPNTWRPTTRETQPYDVYRWQDDSQKTNASLLEVYEDTIPQNFAVNRALAVTANGDQIMTVGSVSDNCADFTKTTETATSSTGVHAKWQGIDFLCDIDNYERNVVGTISSNEVNSVALKGAKSGSHLFFITYTDYNINPDYTTLYNAVSSFLAK
jgi:hypothetical protein